MWMRPARGHGTLGRSTLRVIDSAGDIVGAAFPIDSTVVASCAHVVAQALHLDPDAAAAPHTEVTLAVPGDDGLTQVTARVRHWRIPQPDGSGDIVLLDLPAPIEVTVPPMWRANQPWDHPFRAQGFPAGLRDGVWTTGRLRETQGSGWIQLRTDPGEPDFEGGFSGTPVWDCEAEAVVGMAVAAGEIGGASTAFVIPIAEVLGVDPSLLPNPYRGLEAFDEHHHAYFFGRDEEIDRLTQAYRHSPVVAVTGHSGAGKSSLVRAGLLPKLRRDGCLIAEARLLPYSPWRHTLAAGLAQLAGRPASPFPGEPDISPQHIRQLAWADGPQRLLFLDQFEELAAEDPAAARDLFGLLAALPPGGESKLHVVLTLRADSITDMLDATTAGLLDHATVYVAAMNRTGLRAVIEGPAARAPGLYFETGLVERIIDDAGDVAGRLPLVESLLTQLWQRRDGGYMTLAAYDQIGGVSGAVTKAAEQAIGELTDDTSRHQLRRLLTGLVRCEADRFVRRQLPLSACDEDLTGLADRLVRHRLLVMDASSGPEPIIELTHQALIEQWHRLRDWLTQDREFLRWRDRFEQHHTDWRAGDRAAGLLLRGAALTEARRWHRERATDLSPEQRMVIRSGGRRYLRRRVLAAATVAGIVALTVAATTVLAPALSPSENDNLAGQVIQDGSTPEGAQDSSPSGSASATSPSAGPDSPTLPNAGKSSGDTTPSEDDGGKAVELPVVTVPESVKAECPDREICFWENEDFTGAFAHLPMGHDLACRRVTFTAHAVYSNAAGRQWGFTGVDCDGDQGILEMQTGYAPVDISGYSHT
jgi:hypothetical protein